MRIDYALLSRHSIQSVSDQVDYKLFAHIAAASPSAVLPEQAAIWSYPLKDADEEATIFNMINAILLRVHQSGRIDLIHKKCFDLVKEGISYYKSMRESIPTAQPFWPIGFPKVEDGWISLGLNCGNKIYLAVWRLGNSADCCKISLDQLAERNVSVICAYPSEQTYPYRWDETKNQLLIQFNQTFAARLYEIILL